MNGQHTEPPGLEAELKTPTAAAMRAANEILDRWETGVPTADTLRDVIDRSTGLPLLPLLFEACSDVMDWYRNIPRSHWPQFAFKAEKALAHEKGGE